MPLLLLFAFFLLGGVAVAQQAPQPAPASPAPGKPSLIQAAQEIVFQGKLYCSLKREAVIIFDGEIEELRVRAGQKVKAGEILLTYRLTPEVVQALRTRVSTATLTEIDAKIAGIDADSLTAKAKIKELESLKAGGFINENKLVAPKNEISALSAQRDFLVKQRGLTKQLLEEDIRQLKSLLGDVIDYDKVPSMVSLKSPIDGHVTAMDPETRPGAFVKANTRAVSIGVMDPMVVRAQLYEAEAIKVKPGDKAVMTLSTLPDRSFEVIMTRVSWTPVTVDIDKPTFYEVELSAPNPDLILKEGFKAQITFRP